MNVVYFICLYDENEECFETLVFSTKEKRAEALKFIDCRISLETHEVDPDMGKLTNAVG